MSWYPDSNQKLACAYSIFEFQKGVGTTSMKSYVWDIGEPFGPSCLTLATIFCDQYHNNMSMCCVLSVGPPLSWLLSRN